MPSFRAALPLVLSDSSAIVRRTAGDALSDLGMPAQSGRCVKSRGSLEARAMESPVPQRGW